MYMLEVKELPLLAAVAAGMVEVTTTTAMEAVEVQLTSGLVEQIYPTVR